MCWTATSLLYDDGKMLKGIGTRASKSRLTTFQCENTSRIPFSGPKGYHKKDLYFLR